MSATEVMVPRHAPGDIWGELGKLCYYTFIGD